MEKSRELKDKDLRVRISSQLLDELRVLSYVRGQPYSEFVRDMIRKGIDIVYGDISSVIPNLPGHMIDKIKADAKEYRDEVYKTLRELQSFKQRLGNGAGTTD